jgi:hypothetical protein
MSETHSIQKLYAFMFLLVGRMVVDAHEVFISTFMLVKSVLEPQNPVCIVDRRLEFCA